jgi:glycosyltransferase involved in cell wall biosynthesis
VVIPAYNVAPYIGDTLRSVFAQTLGIVEVIVVNDGSPDTEDLERTLAPYRERIVYVTQENRGVSAARNHGIRLATGDFVAFLDGDDEWLPHYLADQLSRAAADPGAAVFYGDAEIFGDPPEAGRHFMERSPSSGQVDFLSLATQRCTVMTTAMVRRDLFSRIGVLDEQLRSSEDFDLWLRAANAGASFNYTSRVLSRYRRRANGLSADPVWMSRHVIMVLEKCLATMALTPDLAARVVRHRQMVAAQLRFFEGKRAFFRHDVAAAIAGLEDANRVLRRPKLTVAVWLLRTAPRLLDLLYDVRERVLFAGASTKY